MTQTEANASPKDAALKLADALNELLESFEKDGKFCKSSSIRNELYDRLKQTLEESKEALSQQSNERVESVAVMELYTDGWDLVEGIDTDWLESLPFGTKLHTTSPQEQRSCDMRTWVGLTTDEYDAAIVMDSIEAAVTFVEAKLKAKNGFLKEKNNG